MGGTGCGTRGDRTPSRDATRGEEKPAAEAGRNSSDGRTGLIRGGQFLQEAAEATEREEILSNLRFLLCQVWPPSQRACKRGKPKPLQVGSIRIFNGVARAGGGGVAIPSIPASAPVKRLLAFLVLCAAAAPASAQTPAHAAAPLAALPLKQNGGTWPTSHVQGIAVDLRGGHIYYSFTTLLAKYDFSGRLVGTLVGWAGHLGDLDFNPRDGRVYGSLEYKQDRAFYIAVIDVGRIDRVGIDAQSSEIFRTVFLPEVAADYSADLDGDGVFAGDTGKTADHRYGCSGIDGVSFGPQFGRTDGPALLTVAYGIYSHPARTDNDHQVLLQYDIADWSRYARPLVESAPHHSGPAAVHGKYFVRTGNTNYGVQNLAYDESTQRWFMGVYKGTKPAYPNYTLFAVDARTAPTRGDLVGVPGPGGRGTEQGLLLALADGGLKHAATGIRGWNQKADVGLQPVGHGLFYLAVNSGTRGAQTGDLTLYRWTGAPAAPFVPATSADLRK